uniref:Cystatin domain-containing protein n=1 Tax=Ciona savignyi TaxID=51511 RepID=H2ZLU8_CIOSA
MYMNFFKVMRQISKYADEYQEILKQIIYEGSGHGLQESPIRVASTVETEPPCMLPGEVTSSGHRRDTTSHFREVLNFKDLTSEEVQLATRIAQHQYMESSTYDLKITKLLGGCKQYISGYLYFLMFKAIQTTPCQFVSQQNCTGVIKLYQECRARVHTSYLVPWNPFYVACHPTSYYSLPWRRLVS